jgi:hypothetical protein
VCPQSPFGVLKSCVTKTNWASQMRFAADYSEALEVFFDVDRWNMRPSLRFSVSCLWSSDFFQEQTFNVNTYLDMMQLYAVPQIEHLTATHHFARRWCFTHWGLCLNRTFPGTWIGRDGPMPWPTRSPDITPLDFFLWGYVKSNVFRAPVNGLDDLKSRIRIFQRICSTELGKSSNIVWTLSVLPREPTSRSTEVSKNNLPQTTYS